jgi:hypothetical protein
MSTPLLSGSPYLRALLDAMPFAVFVVDDACTILDVNQAGMTFAETSERTALLRPYGEALCCIVARHAEHGCGSDKRCEHCVIRSAVNAVMTQRRSSQRMTSMQLLRKDSVYNVSLMVTATPFAYEGRELVLVVVEDITEMTALRKLLPICAHCRKIRNDNDYWQDVELYLREHAGVEFSHGICPDCVRSHYPEIASANQQGADNSIGTDNALSLPNS